MPGTSSRSAPVFGLDAVASDGGPAAVLQAGSTLGAFEILGPLGAGGMGQVYRARDTRLDRIVAVKIIAPELARSPPAGSASNAKRAPSPS